MAIYAWFRFNFQLYPNYVLWFYHKIWYCLVIALEQGSAESFFEYYHFRSGGRKFYLPYLPTATIKHDWVQNYPPNPTYWTQGKNHSTSLSFFEPFHNKPGLYPRFKGLKRVTNTPTTEHTDPNTLYQRLRLLLLINFKLTCWKKGK